MTRHPRPAPIPTLARAHDRLDWACQPDDDAQHPRFAGCRRALSRRARALAVTTLLERDGERGREMLDMRRLEHLLVAPGHGIHVDTLREGAPAEVRIMVAHQQLHPRTEEGETHRARLGLIGERSAPMRARNAQVPLREFGNLTDDLLQQALRTSGVRPKQVRRRSKQLGGLATYQARPLLGLERVLRVGCQVTLELSQTRQAGLPDRRRTATVQ